MNKFITRTRKGHIFELEIAKNKTESIKLECKVKQTNKLIPDKMYFIDRKLYKHINYFIDFGNI